MSTASVIDSVIKSNPVLSHQEQVDLVNDWQRNSNKLSLDKLVLSNMKLINKEAFSAKKKNGHLSYDDLVQEGIAGLLKAANMFDSSHEVKFITYAMLWVKANMRAHVMSNRSIVKMGTTRDDRVLFNNLSKVSREADLSGVEGEAKVEYISKRLGVGKGSVRKMLCSTRGYDTRLDAPVKSDDGSETLRVTLLEDEGSGEAQTILDVASEKKVAILEATISSLPESESKIIRDRYLADNPKTLRELEKEMSISREWIRKLEMRALNRVKKRLKTEYGISDMLDI